LPRRKPGEAAGWYRKYIDKSGGDKERQRIGYLGLAAALEDGGQFGPRRRLRLLRRALEQRQPSGSCDARSGAKPRARGTDAKAVEIYKKITLLPQARRRSRTPPTFAWASCSRSDRT
jgi:hypothetical protein